MNLDTTIAFSVYGKKDELSSLMREWKTQLPMELRDVEPPKGYAFLLCDIPDSIPQSEHLQFLIKELKQTNISSLRTESMSFDVGIMLVSGGGFNISRDLLKEVASLPLNFVITAD